MNTTTCGGLMILSSLVLLASIYFWALGFAHTVEASIEEADEGVPP